MPLPTQPFEHIVTSDEYNAIIDQVNANELAIAQADATRPRILYSGQGSSTAAGATNVATLPLNVGFTGEDLDGTAPLVIDYVFESVTQATGMPVIVNLTDGGTILALSPVGTVAAGALVMGRCYLWIGAQDVVTYMAKSEAQSTAGTVTGNIGRFTAVTPFNNPWTIGVQHGGVTSGGTLYYRVSVSVMT